MRPRRVGAAIALAALVATGCTRATDDATDDGSGDGNTVAAPLVHAASLERFDACPELLGYLKKEGAARVGPWGLNGVTRNDVMALEDSGAGGDASTSAAAPGAERGSADTDAKNFSGTNVQEASVDEPDKVKTNGEHIFTTRMTNDGRVSLVAIATDGGRPSRAGEVRLPEGAGTELLLVGDRIVVFGMGAMLFARGGVAMDMMMPGGGGGGDTIVAIVDVSDPTQMRVANTLKLEGSYLSARMVGGVVRMVLNSYSGSRVDFVQPDPTGAETQDATARNKEAITESKIEDWLPRFEVEDGKGAKQNDGQLTTCDSTYRPKTFSGFQTTSVVTIDPSKPDPRNSASVLGSAGTIYASADNLYVATVNWGEPQPLPVSDGGGPNAPMVAPAPTEPVKTMLHRFDISDAAKAQYAASGEVRGTVLNQWSLSEHGGHLRVATTEDENKTSDDGVPATSSYVTTFKANEPKLTQVGQIGNLGKGERIYGVRFIGDVGYVVTFRQVDPLHVLDLADPAKPRLLGELKIPGYSAYLHPVGEGLLLGVGQDVDPETSRPLGSQLSLFDVSDPTEPTRIAQIRIDNASTPVEFDHHAFTWWEPRSLAIVPVSRYEGFVEPSGDGREIAPDKIEQLHAAIGYRIADRRIAEVGRASHTRHVTEEGFAQIDRTMVIGDAVYSFSVAGVMSSDLASFDERGWLAFPTPN